MPSSSHERTDLLGHILLRQIVSAEKRLTTATMAYAYPSGGDANASSASLVHSSPGKSTTTTRKGSEDKFDVLREFKAG